VISKLAIERRVQYGAEKMLDVGAMAFKLKSVLIAVRSLNNEEEQAMEASRIKSGSGSLLSSRQRTRRSRCSKRSSSGFVEVSCL
jgi:hypothetical protein